MKVKDITIYLPDGNRATYEIGYELKLRNGNKIVNTGKTVKKIKVDDKGNKAEIVFDNKETLMFKGMKYSISYT